MKRLFAIFVLRPAEQRLVIFVVLLLVAAAWLKQHRDSGRTTSAYAAETATPLPNEQ